MNQMLYAVAAVFMGILYSLVFYLQYKHKILLDFSSLYFASESLNQGINPYRALSASFFPVQKLPTNLNPPCVLWFFQIFLPLGYDRALILWLFLSTCAGVKAAAMTYHLLKEKLQFPMSKNTYWLLYIASYPVLMNTVIGQLGSFLYFFILLGYHYASKEKPWQAGVLWGTIAAFKLFPLLLLVYAFLNKQKEVAFIMLATFILITFLPLCFYSPNLYTYYLSLMHKVLWYGDNWNASFYGMLFRVLIDPLHTSPQQLIFINCMYALFFLMGLVLYGIKAKKWLRRGDLLGSLDAFNLTLAMMLFLSPLGWLYYFPLLIVPAYTLWTRIQRGCNRLGQRDLIITYGALALLSCPIIYIQATATTRIGIQLTILSCHFYGLLLLVIGLLNPPKIVQPSYSAQDILILNRLLLLLITVGVLSIAYYTGYAFILDK